MFTALFLALACLFFYVARNIMFNMAYRHMPWFSGWLPLIGHSYMMLGMNKEALWTLLKKFQRDALNCDGVICASLGTFVVMGVADPDDANTVTNACLDKRFLYKLGKPWFGDGLLISDVPVWKKHRKVLNQSFTRQALVGYLKVFNFHARQLSRELESQVGKPFDPEHILIKSDLKTICKTTTGIDAEFYSKHFNDYIYASHNFLNVLIIKFLNDLLPFAYNMKKYFDVMEKFHNLSSTLLRLRKAELYDTKENNTAQTENFKPIMDNMLALAHKEKIFTDQEVKSELDVIIFAGHDTTATTMGYILLLLGSHPEVQDKAYKEVLEVFSDSERDLDNVDLAKLVYLDCVIKETVRLYPIAPAVARTSSTDIKLRNYTIPADTPMVICIWAIQRHSLWGEDPDVFRPERWLDPANATAFSKAFYGFSAGRRGCIGKNYAIMTMKITLAHIIRKYQITSDIRKLRLEMKVLVKPTSGNEITVKVRN